jgi:hypothetical protein
LPENDPSPPSLKSLHATADTCENDGKEKRTSHVIHGFSLPPVVNSQGYYSQERQNQENNVLSLSACDHHISKLGTHISKTSEERSIFPIQECRRKYDEVQVSPASNAKEIRSVGTIHKHISESISHNEEKKYDLILLDKDEDRLAIMAALAMTELGKKEFGPSETNTTSPAATLYKEQRSRSVSSTPESAVEGSESISNNNGCGSNTLKRKRVEENEVSDYTSSSRDSLSPHQKKLCHDLEVNNDSDHEKSLQYRHIISVESSSPINESSGNGSDCSYNMTNFQQNHSYSNGLHQKISYPYNTNRSSPEIMSGYKSYQYHRRSPPQGRPHPMTLPRAENANRTISPSSDDYVPHSNLPTQMPLHSMKGDKNSFGKSRQHIGPIRKRIVAPSPLVTYCTQTTNTLPKSLSFRKICSKCGKTRSEHGELGFGNKCVYQDCGRCGAGIHMHMKAGVPMGFSCTLKVEDGAIPCMSDMYDKKIRDLAAMATLKKEVLAQEQQHAHILQTKDES